VTALRVVLRDKRPLRGEDAIGMKVGTIFARNPMKKHFALEIGESTFSWSVTNDSVEEERRLDGLDVIRTNIDESQLCSTDAVRTYKRLAKVERAFRCMKLSDLEIRPAYYWRSDRVHAHVFLCMLAYYIEWHMRKALSPILFEEHDDDLPVHSFLSLLKDLATLTSMVV
jgi:hypothetical protein